VGETLIPLANITRKFSKKWVLSIIVGLVLSWSTINHILNVNFTHGKIFFLAILMSVVFLVPTTYVVLYGIIEPQLALLSRRGKIMTIIGAVTMAIFLLATIPVRIPGLPEQHSIEIVATGQKNQLANASEVWLLSFQRNDGTNIPWTEFQLGTGWEVRDQALISTQNQPASLRWQGLLNGNPTLTFVSHPWSGTVDIKWQGGEQKLDLFNDSSIHQTVVLPLYSEIAKTPAWFIFAGSLLATDLISLVLLLILGTILFIKYFKTRTLPVNVPRRMAFYYALPSMIVWLGWLLVFYPGLMSSDSMDQWQQTMNGMFVAEHPILHTLMIGLINHIWFSPAAVALVQIFVLAIIVGWGLRRLCALGVSPSVTWLFAALFAILPVNGLYAITLWKDIPYSITVFILTILMVDIAMQGADWIKSRQNLIVLCVVLTFSALLRLNGPAVAFGIPLVLALVFRKYWKRYLIVAGTAIIIWLLINGPVIDLLGARRSNWVNLQPFIHQIAAHQAAKTPLSVEDQQYIESISVNQNPWDYSCFGIKTILKTDLRLENIQETKIMGIWWRTLIANPVVNFQHMLCSSSLIWQISSPGPNSLYAVNLWMNNNEIHTIVYNTVGLQLQSVLPQLSVPLTVWVVDSQNGPWNWLLWRPAIYLYLGLAGIALVAIKRKNRLLLLAAIPILLHTLGLFPAVINQDLRFQYPVILTGLFFCAMFFVPTYEKDEADNSQANSILNRLFISYLPTGDEEVYDTAKRAHPIVDELIALVKYRELLSQFVVRSIKTRYKRSFLGVVWTLLNPLLTMIVLSVVFSTLFRFNIPHYSVYLLSGIVAWNFFSSATNQAMAEMAINGGLMNRIYLPKAVIVVSSIGTAMVNLGFSFIPLILIALVTAAPVNLSILSILLGAVLLLMFSLGVGLILATLAIFFADMIPVYEVLLSVWFYSTPIIYPLDIIPAQWIWLFKLNPMYYLIDLFRQPMFSGTVAPVETWLIASFCAVVVLVIGWVIFTSKTTEYAYRV
jgi:ABC-type polysaccharide/polyol phosphate export permease